MLGRAQADVCKRLTELFVSTQTPSSVWEPAVAAFAQAARPQRVTGLLPHLRIGRRYLCSAPLTGQAAQEGRGSTGPVFSFRSR